MTRILEFCPSRKNQPTRSCGSDTQITGAVFLWSLIHLIPGFGKRSQKTMTFAIFAASAMLLTALRHIFSRLPLRTISTRRETKWEYEKEWRLILNFNSAACKVGKDNTGTDVLLFASPPDCLMSVTVGYSASHEFVEQIQTAIATNPSLSHLCLKAARRREDDSIDIGAIDPG